MEPTVVLCGWTHYRPPRTFNPETGAIVLLPCPDPLASRREFLRTWKRWQDAGGFGSLIFDCSVTARTVPAD